MKVVRSCVVVEKYKVRFTEALKRMFCVEYVLEKRNSKYPNIKILWVVRLKENEFQTSFHFSRLLQKNVCWDNSLFRRQRAGKNHITGDWSNWRGRQFKYLEFSNYWQYSYSDALLRRILRGVNAMNRGWHSQRMGRRTWEYAELTRKLKSRRACVLCTALLNTRKTGVSRCSWIRLTQF